MCWKYRDGKLATALTVAALVNALVLICLHAGVWFRLGEQFGVRASREQIHLLPNPSAGSFKLIPKLLHQTYNTSEVPAAIQKKIETWRDKNPGWDVRFYNDSDCLHLVMTKFPQYLPAYKALPKAVERADFFRYMVVLSKGGFYADVDTDCRKPLDDLIRPEDRMLVGWESEFGSFQEKEQECYARQRQVLQWLFGGVAGHPLLRDICDKIVDTTSTIFSADPNANTEDKTGPGLFTDLVLQHARNHPHSVDPGYIRVLPRSIWGAAPKARPNPNRASLHWNLGSWKVDEVQAAQQRRYTEVERVESESFAKQLFPVSIIWDPPFTMLLPIKQKPPLLESELALMDVPHTLTLWGGWHYPTFLIQQPTALEAVLVGLDRPNDEVFLDIGAGYGLFSLAAAAMGRRTISIETDIKSGPSFNASIQYNGFQDLLTWHQVAVGRAQEPICLDRLLNCSSYPALSSDLDRGYGLPRLHAVTRSCRKRATRQRLSSLLPRGTRIAALRISTAGWAGWILDDLEEVVKRSKPSSILLDFYPDMVEITNYPGGAQGILDQLTSWGYTTVLYMGYHCVEQRLFMLRSKEPNRDWTDQDAADLPGWCSLQPGGLVDLSKAGDRYPPEMLLFQHGEGRPSPF